MKRFSKWINEQQNSVGIQNMIDRYHAFIKLLSNTHIPNSLKEPFDGWILDVNDLYMIGSFKFIKILSYNKEQDEHESIEINVGPFWAGSDAITLQYNMEFNDRGGKFVSWRDPKHTNLMSKLKGLDDTEFSKKIIELVIDGLKAAITAVLKQMIEELDDPYKIVKAADGEIEFFLGEIPPYLDTPEIANAIKSIKLTKKFTSTFGKFY
jgi:hypothetical protein